MEDIISDEEKTKLQRSIEYWIKHQELDKLNYTLSLSEYFTIMSIGVALIIGVVSAVALFDGTYTKPLIILIVILIVLIFLIIYIKRPYVKKLKDNNLSFRIREAMLRKWYNDLGVKTDLLDTQFDEIKKICKNRVLSNKILEIIAKDVLKK